MVSATHGPSTSLAAAVAGNHVSGSKSRRNRGLFRRLSSGCQQSDYCAPVYASCAQNWRRPGHELQTSLKKARMMLQVVLGAEKRKERQAPLDRTAAVQDTARGWRRCSRASGRSGPLSGIAGRVERIEAPSRGSKVPPRVTLSRLSPPSLKHAPANIQIDINHLQAGLGRRKVFERVL